MAQKLREILSSLATDVKAINLDDRISFRFLNTKFNDKISYFLRQEAKSREIFKDFSLWKSINCIDLIDVNSNACGFIDECKTLKRSEKQIPEAFNTNWGQLIKILTLSEDIEFKGIRSSELSDYLNREYSKPTSVYWLQDQYIYIPNTNLETVKGLIIPKDASAVDKFNCDLSQCASPLDGIVSYPDYLITLAKQEVLKELSGVYKRTIEDEKGDDNTNSKQ